MNKNQEKILKKIISESSTPGYENRKFGDSLPTLASVQKAYGEKLNEATKPIDKQLVSQWEKMCTFLQRKMDEFKKTIPKNDVKHGMANGAYNYLNSVKPIPGQWLEIEKTLGEGNMQEDTIKEGIKSNIMQKWDKVDTIQDDLRQFILSAKDAGGSDLLRDIADTLKLMSNYAMGEYKKSKR